MAIAAGLAAVGAWTVPVAGGAGTVRDSAERVLIGDIIARWNAAVEADLSADPFSGAEATVLGRLSLPDVIAYGSTLLVAAFMAEFAVFTQIGDGDIVAVRPDGQSLSPVPADDSLDGWLTTSLCQPDAEEAFRTGVVHARGQPAVSPCCSRPMASATPRPMIPGRRDLPWTWSSWAAITSRAGSPASCRAGRSSVPPWMAAATTPPWPWWSARRYAGPGTPPQEAGLHSRTEPSRTIVLPSPAARQPPALAGETLPGHPRPSYSGTGQPAARPARDRPSERADGGRAGGDPGFFQQFRVRLLWLAAAMVVILGGTGLALVLTGGSQGGPAPHPRPAHHVTSQPQPSPTAAASSSRASQRPHNQHRHQPPKKTKQQARSRK